MLARRRSTRSQEALVASSSECSSFLSVKRCPAPGYLNTWASAHDGRVRSATSCMNAVSAAVQRLGCALFR